MATSWCHKMQWLLDKAKTDGWANETFTPDELAKYEEPAEAAEFYVHAQHASRVRIDAMCAHRPTSRG